jgi:hypothetical protein
VFQPFTFNLGFDPRLVAALVGWKIYPTTREGRDFLLVSRYMGCCSTDVFRSGENPVIYGV